MKNDIIQYGIGKEYLSNWGVKEALREIYQNFLDFGEYTQTVDETIDNTVRVRITNDYKPEGLEFLQIGKSGKRDDSNTIGQHGEGLKMAALVFLREGLTFRIRTHNTFFKPFWNEGMIGETLAFKVVSRGNNPETFSIDFTCSKKDYETFIATIITEKDIKFTAPYYGSVVKRRKGNIYVGGLFVCKLENYKRAYNFKPSVVPLDRDRSMPSSFDVNWAASKINEEEAKWNTVDTEYNDFEYVKQIPQHIKERYKPVAVGNSIQFVEETPKGETIVLKNKSIIDSLSTDSFFTKALSFLRKKLLQGLGVYELLEKFKEKYSSSLSQEGKQDLEHIINQIKNK